MMLTHHFCDIPREFKLLQDLIANFGVFSNELQLGMAELCRLGQYVRRRTDFTDVVYQRS